MLVEIQNCGRAIKFTPEFVYPGKYSCIGRCHPLEMATESGKTTATVEIDGEGYANGTGNLTAICKETSCPLIIKAS